MYIYIFYASILLDFLFLGMARDNFHLEKACLSKGMKSHTEK